MDGEHHSLVFRGYPPLHCCCDSAWRRLPNGDQAVFFMTGGVFEPETSNFVGLCRSTDEGVTWGPLEIVHRSAACEADLQKPPHNMDPRWRDRCVPEIATTMSEVVVHDGRITVYLQIHDGHFGHWRTAAVTSDDNGRTWSAPVPFAPKPTRSMIRNLYRTSWGEWLLPYQYQPTRDNTEASFMDDPGKLPQRNGVLVGPSPDGPWQAAKHELVASPGWAEVNVVELSDGRLVMLCRTQTGVLHRSDSVDRGRTWSDYVPTDIPNPASKFRLFKLPDGRIALLHNPNPDFRHPNDKRNCSVGRSPLSLWISDDDLRTWSYRRDICVFPGALEYPDGELDADGLHLHFAFDYNRHDVLYWKIRLP
jgi:hypothetical protein